jgi:hypothetical protein
MVPDQLESRTYSNDGNNGYYNLALWAENPTRAWSVAYPATIEAGRVSGRELLFDIVHSIAGTARLNAVWGTGTELWIVSEKGGRLPPRRRPADRHPHRRGHGHQPQRRRQWSTCGR